MLQIFFISCKGKIIFEKTVIKEQWVKFETINFNGYENQNDGFWHMTIVIPIYSSQLRIYVPCIETGH